MTGMMNSGLSGSQFSDVQAPQAICIAPTRELAKQIHQEAHKFSFKTMLRAVVCYGGANVMHQSNQIKKGCHLLVATPGRLIDFVERGKVLNGLSFGLFWVFFISVMQHIFLWYFGSCICFYIILIY